MNSETGNKNAADSGAPANTAELLAGERNQLLFGLKKTVIEECNALKVTPEQVGNDEPIIAGTGALQLDSLDAVELVGMIERNFGVKLDNAGDARKVLTSFNVLADFITTKSARSKIDAFLAKFS